MRVYLAARFSRLPELNAHADELEAMGITVASRWLRGGHEWVGTPDEEIPLARLHRFAAEDLEDIDAADILVCFTEPAQRDQRRLPGPDEDEVWSICTFGHLTYRVSTFGRVMNGEGELITGSLNRGYRRVKPDGKYGTTRTVHSMVMEAFSGPCPQGFEIDHLDGYKANNYWGNLEYVTHEENVRRAADRMRNGPHAGESNGRAKLTQDDAFEIRRRARSEVKAAIARDYGVSDVLVGKIARGELWPDSNKVARGGRHVEMGYALGTGKPVICVGHRENVFYCLDHVFFVPDWTAALHLLVNTSAVDLGAQEYAEVRS